MTTMTTKARSAIAAATASGRPVILLVAGRLPRIINEVEEALVNADLGLYLRAGRIVHIVEEVFKRPDETEIMVVVINEVNDYALLETMARTARLSETHEGRHSHQGGPAAEARQAYQRARIQAALPAAG